MPGASRRISRLPTTASEPDSGKTFTAQQLTIVEHHRFEGASDPDDMSVVYGIEASDGTRGVVVDAYGVYADPRLSEVLKNVTIREELQQSGWRGEKKGD